MRKIALVLLLFTFFLPAQNYQTQWQAVQEFEDQSLPKSALEQVTRIYQQALKENNDVQLIKALLYREKYTVELSEAGMEMIIYDLEKELSQPHKTTTKLLLKSILGQLYMGYLDANYYQIYQRTTVQENNDSDIAAWSVKQLTDRASALYLESLDSAAQRVKIEHYQDILTEPAYSEGLRPTLYDFLAFRALDHFQNERYSLSEVANQFHIDQPQAFGNTSTFLNYTFKSPNEKASKYQALLIYQQLLRFHLKKGDTKALNHINFERLQFVNQNYTGADKEERYLKILNYYQTKYINSEALYYLAEYYYAHEQYTQAMVYIDKALKSQEPYLISICQEIKERITVQSLRSNIESVNLPDENLLARIDYRNISQLFVKVIRLTPEEQKTLRSLDQTETIAFLQTHPAQREFDLTLPSQDDYREHSTEINLGSYPLGTYQVIMTQEGNISNKPLHEEMTVSRIAYLQRDKQFLVVDRASGEPLEGVEANFYSTSYDYQTRQEEMKLITQRKSNAEGLIEIPKIDSFYMVNFVYGEDRLEYRQGGYYYGGNYYTADTKPQQSVHFFTDRSIYRPGQTVYFKGLATETSTNKPPKLLTRKALTVALYDTNYQSVKEQKFTTDEYGTFHGSFTLPKSGLNGEMQIRAEIGGAIAFHVEEYKRPKFEVTFNPLESSYRLGDRVTIKGSAKAYSGYGLEGATVNYIVKRTASFPWIAWWQPIPPHYPETQMARGELKTGSNGEFTIIFDAQSNPEIPAADKPNYNYEISVDITDTTGETQSATKSVTVGYIAANVALQIDEELEQNATQTLKLDTTNLDGVFQAMQGKLRIEKLTPDTRLYRERYWQNIDSPLYTQEQFEQFFPHYAFATKEPAKTTVQTLPFDTQKSQELSLHDLKQGEYLLTVISQDRYGTAIEKSKKITIYDTSATEPPYPTELWVGANKQRYEAGDTATIALKSSVPKMHLMLDIERQSQLADEKWVSVEHAAQELIPIHKTDRGDIYYTLTYVLNNRSHTITARLEVPWDNQLQIELITFRDQLQPDQEEEWQLKISGKNREKVMAQMVATMYDAALDSFVSSNFTMPNLFPKYQPDYYHQWEAKQFQSVSDETQWRDYTERLTRQFRELEGFQSDSSRGVSYGYAMSENVANAEAAPPSPAPMMEASASVDAYPIESSAKSITYESGEAKDASMRIAKPTPSQPIAIRKNLEESLFFKPDIQTDKEGNIILKFKTNDALTRWKFMALAHTKTLQMGIIEKEITTQKELMVVTNLPRFFREHDTITLSGKVVNTSNQEINGTCIMKLVNPLNNEAIFPDQNFTQPFSLAKGASTTVSYSFTVPDVDKVSAIQHTLIAQSDTHTDAEQVVKPILTNRTFVTEGITLPIAAQSTQNFTLESLRDNNSTTLKNYRLTLEISSNPAWYAIQALPYLMEFPHECNEQLFNRYFANTLAAHIANQSPKIKKVFESWKSKEELWSALSTNAELKSLLLEETPWVLTAQSETEQMNRIGLLFDLNRMAAEQQTVWDKLTKRQNEDKGWSWFEGGYSNWYITQYITEGLGRLKQLGIKTPELETFAFLDRQVLETYNDLLQAVEHNATTLEEDHLSSILIHYLYTKSLFNVKEKTTAQHYYLDQAKKYWTKKGLHEQTLIALAMHRYGEKEIAQAIIKSLKERAITDSEKGMYFKYTRGFSWNEMPIETHALMIELFENVAHDQAAVEQLTVWLLKNKQTNHWSTTKATTGAIHALLYNSQWLTSDKLVEAKFDTAVDYQPALQQAQKTAQVGTGYYKAAFETFDTDMSTVTLTNPNKHIAWGGLYWQYFENMDKVKRFQETPLQITKTLYLDKPTDMGNTLIAIDKLPLKVGDRLKVQIKIKVDRDMEFIMLKDARASAFEPINVISQYKWQDGLGYYESTKDNATYFFIDSLPRGTYVFEYPLVVTHQGVFSNGITTIESMYAPEFRSHSEGISVEVK